MHPPMSPLTERVRIEAEQNIFAREAEWNARAVPVCHSLRHTADGIISHIREGMRGIQSFYQSRRYSFHVAEKSLKQPK